MSTQGRTEFVIETVKELLKNESVMEISFDDDRVKDSMDDLKKIQVRRQALMKDQIVISPKNSERILILRHQNEIPKVTPPALKTAVAPKKKAVKAKKPASLGYIEPNFHGDIIAMLLNPNPQNLWFWGPTGCGKTEYVKHLGKSMDRKIFRINCREDMDSATFIGDKTIEIDEKTGQNHIQFIEGQVLKAMKEGLDDKGNPTGNPAILYIPKKD